MPRQCAETTTRILLASPRLARLAAFREALEASPGVSLAKVATGQAALETAKASAPDLIAIDAGLPDFEPLALAKSLLFTNAMIHVAAVSSLSDADFHEASEGLGLLARLDDPPGPKDAATLLKALRAVRPQS